jgi:hypothetical protein
MRFEHEGVRVMRGPKRPFESAVAGFPPIVGADWRE